MVLARLLKPTYLQLICEARQASEVMLPRTAVGDQEPHAENVSAVAEKATAREMLDGYADWQANNNCLCLMRPALSPTTFASIDNSKREAQTMSIQHVN